MKSSVRQKKKRLWVLIILCCGLIGISFFVAQRNSGEFRRSHGKEPSDHGTQAQTTKTKYTKTRLTTRASHLPDTGPKGEFRYIYDTAGTNHFLLSKYDDDKFLPETDAPAGSDLWIQDASGNERKIDTSVYRARFSPDGNKIAYTTTESVLRVEDLNGQKLAEVPGAYEPSWTPDSQKVLFAQVPEGSDTHMPETAHLAILDLATHETRLLTDGAADDSRPHAHPSGDWILFTSGSRSGLASFWKVPLEGGEPVQVTNVGLEEVNEKFVPTPYKRTLWSQDRRWFLYDFKNGDLEETWGLEFDADGIFKQGRKLADGLDPQWREDGKSFASIKYNGNAQEITVANLP